MPVLRYLLRATARRRLGSGPAREGITMRRPNILFITCHDLGRHLGCYGHPTIHSPALDTLAAQGVRLANAFCTAPQCSPSRAALHTGRYPHATGVLGLAHPPFGWRLAPPEKHLAQRLAEAGYLTALVGMQHLIEHGHAEELGYARVWPVAPAREEAATAATALRELAADARPFYLEVGFEEPHRPYDRDGVQPDAGQGVEVPPYLPDGPEARRDFAAFQGAVRAMDAAVGRILAALDDQGPAAGTWVVFSADHGIAMPRAKGTLYDPGIEVAMLMRWPDGGLQGRPPFAPLMSNVDIVPTMLEGLGMPLPDTLQGRSLWPLLHGAAATPRAEIFAEKTFHTYYEPMRAIRTTTHKYIANFEVSTAVDVPADVRESPIYPLMLPALNRERPYVELYDLVADPGEQTNLAGCPEVAALEADLRGRLLRWMRDTDDPLLRGPVASPYYYEALRRLEA
jgi:arylsulfatase A-like enzyme